MQPTSKPKTDATLDKAAQKKPADRQAEAQVGQTISRAQLKQVGGGTSLPVNRW